jgi:nucleoside-diphosphate-sugar epimerase
MPPKILILGGTRFIGKTFVERLCEMNFEITLSSRRHQSFPKQINQLTCLRSELHKFHLNLEQFDFVFDFNAYTDNDFYEIPEGVPSKRYFFISTNWIYKLNQNGKSLEGAISARDRDYVIAKEKLESLILDRFDEKAMIIRLPVVIGRGDHHRRINFYLNRILTQSTIHVIEDNPGVNFIWIDDLIELLTNFVTFGEIKSNLVSITPSDKFTPKMFISELANEILSDVRIVSVRKEVMLNQLNQIYAADPLHGEVYEVPSNQNLWAIKNYSEKPLAQKLSNIEDFLSLSVDQEIALLQEREYIAASY